MSEAPKSIWLSKNDVAVIQGTHDRDTDDMQWISATVLWELCKRWERESEGIPCVEDLVARSFALNDCARDLAAVLEGKKG